MPLEVVTGPMFSGKTDALIARFRAAEQAGVGVVAIKPARDDRHPRDVIVSHSGRSVPALAAADAQEAHLLAGGAALVLFDEIQFFSPELVDAAEALGRAGATVV